MSKASFMVLLICFLPLAFSEELIEAFIDGVRPFVSLQEIEQSVWTLSVVDVILFVTVLPFAVYIWRRARFRWRYPLFWLVALVMTVVVDFLREFLQPRYGSIIERLDVMTSALYVIALGILLAATFSVSPPRQILRRRGEGWPDFRATIPLLTGLLVGYWAGVSMTLGWSVPEGRTAGWVCVMTCQWSFQPKRIW